MLLAACYCEMILRDSNSHFYLIVSIMPQLPLHRSLKMPFLQFSYPGNDTITYKAYQLDIHSRQQHSKKNQLLIIILKLFSVNKTLETSQKYANIILVKQTDSIFNICISFIKNVPLISGGYHLLDKFVISHTLYLYAI